LSPVALIIVLGYSITKRFTALCHLVLGLGLSLAPIGAYLVVAGKFAMLPILFSLVVLFWVSGFDIIYALQDVEFDSEKKLKSIPVYLGKQSALNLSRFLHFLSFSILLFAGYYAQFGTWYWAGWLAFSCLLVYQHTLVSANDLSRVNLAFFTTNGFASLLFSIFFILEMYL
jgi:4-hydroxybenzoate polyprenyltransferase